MKLAFSYYRWSTDRQSSPDKHSRSRQSASAREWIEEHGKALGYKLSDEVFVDSGKSAYTGEHIEKDESGRAKGDLAKFIERVENGSIPNDSILLVDDYSRFSRLKPSKSLNLFLNVINSGIGIVFTGSRKKQIINTQLIDEDSNILSFVIGEVIRSYEESAERSRKVKDAKDDIKAEMASGIVRTNSNFPKFFTFISDRPTDPKCKTGKYVTNDRTKLVQEMIDGVMAGRPMFQIAEEFNRRKEKTFRYGNVWTGKAIRQILRNPILTGEYLGNQNYVPPLMDKETFDRLQNIMDRNKTNKGTRGQMVNIFRGLVFCARCGKAMSFHVKRSKFYDDIFDSPYRYMRCSTQGKFVGCDTNTMSLRVIEFEKEFFTDYLMKSPTSLLTETDNAEIKQLNKEITAKTAELNKETAEIIKLTAVMEGNDDIPELKAKFAERSKKRNELKGELDGLTAKLAAVQDSPEIFEEIKEAIMNIEVDSSDEASVKRFSRLIANPRVDTVTVNGIEFTSGDKKWKVQINKPIDHKKLSKELGRGELETNVEVALKDDTLREKLRVMLPPLVDRIEVDVKAGKFHVYNRMKKLVYESAKYESNANRSKLWQDSLKKWTTRKMKDGRIVKINRKIQPDTP